TCKYELVPPSCYRRSVAEVAIEAFKNHFIAFLAGVDPSFLLSNTTPTISSHAHLFGPFDINRMPLTPLGCPVHIHEPPAKRGSWAPHSKPGWHLGVSQEHYRCHRVCPRDTMTEQVSETVFFKHKYITNPSVTHADMVIKAVHDLIVTLSKRTTNASMRNLRGLKELSKIFFDTAHSEPPATWEDEYVPHPSPTPDAPAPRVQAPNERTNSHPHPAAPAPRPSRPFANLNNCAANATATAVAALRPIDCRVAVLPPAAKAMGPQTSCPRPRPWHDQPPVLP
ncbi:hypothetical protein ACHAWF_006028, partial [Thalassiosira exigua]